MYKWNPPGNYANKNIGEFQYDIADYLLYVTGKPIKDSQIPLPIIKYDVKNDFLEQYDCLPNDALIPVVNERLRVFLMDNAPDDIEFHHVDIVTDEGVSNKFHIVNAIKELPLIDLTKSIYSYIPNTEAIMGFEQVYFVEDEFIGANIARCDKYHPYLMLSTSLVKKMKKEKFKGIGYGKVTSI